MRSLTYKNTLGQEISFGISKPFALTEFEETNSVEIYNNKGMLQDGNTYLNNALDQKDITIITTIIASSKDELIRNREQLHKLFNPKLGEGTLIYKDDEKERKIKCIVNTLPTFSKPKKRVQECLITLTANNPFWTDIKETKKEIALWMGSLEFDLEIPEDGMEFGTRAPSLIVNTINEGHIETGLRIVFKALATVENPSLLNVNTGEIIKINKTMIAGEIITVTTDYGNKAVISTINGIKTDAFNSLDFLNSTFIQLSTGDNLFRYDADSGIDNLEVDIYHTSKYLGV